MANRVTDVCRDDWNQSRQCCVSAHLLTYLLTY